MKNHPVELITALTIRKPPAKKSGLRTENIVLLLNNCFFVCVFVLNTVLTRFPARKSKPNCGPPIINMGAGGTRGRHVAQLRVSQNCAHRSPWPSGMRF